MIYLITGVPGAGKTLNTIKAVDVISKRDNRPVYAAGISELRMDGWNSVSYESLHKWEDLPAKSIVVVDEADLFAPSRGNKGEPPRYIRELARHRHRGLDFYVITQRPKMLDHHLRGLVGKHHHYERAFGANSTRCLTWEQVADDPSDFHARKLALTTRHKFDKSYFGKYKSAEEHTHKPKIPIKVWLVVAGLVGVIGFGVRLITDIQGRSAEISTRADYDIGAIPTSSVATGTVLLNDDGTQVLDREAYIAMRTPRIESIPHSAPIYDTVKEVRTFPRPQCIYAHRSGDCKCYTQQATPLDIDYQSCRSIVSNGWFNPYQEEQLADLGSKARAEQSGAFGASDPAPQNSPRIVYVGGNNRSQGSFSASPAAQPSVSTNQPGGAYRNPVGSAPTQPAQPRFSSP